VGEKVYRSVQELYDDIRGFLKATVDNCEMVDAVDIGDDEWHDLTWEPWGNYIRAIRDETCVFIPEGGDYLMAAITEMNNPGAFADSEDVFWRINDDFNSVGEWFDSYIEKLDD